MPAYDYAIIGGGIVGLATARALAQREPNAAIVVLEKEPVLAFHQSGHNSGVIHVGIYYRPGSLRAQLAVRGNRSMVEFCRQHGIAHDVCGKVIVATAPRELPLLENLYQRGLQNAVAIVKLSPEAVKDYEPHARCLAGLHVPSTGIVDFRQVCGKYAELFRVSGGRIELNTRVEHVHATANGQVLETNRGDFEARLLINCAGLHSDRVARLAGSKPNAKIVPFRGEYYELKPEKRSLVRALIYPVPNPAFPFLGVHFTRMIDGSIHAGPNAVLAFKREGYQKTDFNLRDSVEVMCYPGFWRLAARHAREGIREMYRSFSKAEFVRSLQRLVPEVHADDLEPSTCGVRAQALRRDGNLVDDFIIVHERHAVHVCNAPSPAATASLEISQAIVAQVPRCS